VTDVETTVRFYCDVLGFRCANRFEGWASLQRDSAEIMLSLPNEHLPFQKSLFTGSFYFHSDDVDALWAQLRERIDVVYPIENFDTACASSPSVTSMDTFFNSARKFNHPDFITPFLSAGISSYNRSSRGL
jgi:catechol 2,3-dioxygenase-like lactoylglutathione lyase family enzyme